MEGIDDDRLTAWFGDNVAGAVPPLRIEGLAAGRSRLTVRVTDADGRAWVLRRPPGAHSPAPTHDVGREHRILTAVSAAGVPVPTPVRFCHDESVTGAAFSVVEHVEGHVVRGVGDAEKLLDEAGRRTAGESLVDALAALHAMDVGGAGLGDLGPGQGYLGGQLERWNSQVEAAQDAAGRGVVLIHDMHRFLVERLPAPAAPVLVHGDYRLDNAVLGDDGRVRAILDWKSATLGDPLVDLGQLLVYWTDPGEENLALGVAPTAITGFPTRREIAERYAERSGRDLDHLELYVAFAYWKLACILEGVYARERATGEIDPTQLAALGDQVVRLVEAAHDAVGAAG